MNMYLFYTKKTKGKDLKKNKVHLKENNDLRVISRTNTGIQKLAVLDMA